MTQYICRSQFSCGFPEPYARYSVRYVFPNRKRFALKFPDTGRLFIFLVAIATLGACDNKATDPDDSDSGELLRALGLACNAANLDAVSPWRFAAPLFAVPGLASVPFFLAGALKIAYDLSLWRAFRSRRAPGDPARSEP